MSVVAAGRREVERGAPSAVLAGKYLLGDCIGAGGMGRVYLAEQADLGRTVAVKILDHALVDDPRMVRHFRNEAIAAARVSHPNSVAVYDHGETADGTMFLVMEYVRGRSLSHVVRDEATLEVDRAIRLTIQVLDALGEAHAAGVVHADIKSDNVLVESTRERGEQTKVIDYGLARLTSEHGADLLGFLDDRVSGTPEYMAPEVIRGAPPSPASDIYAVGAMLYELLTGATPFGGGGHMEIMRRHLEDLVVPLTLRSPELVLPAHVEQAVMQALHKDPAHRFASAHALAAALATAGVTPLRRRPRRSRLPRWKGADAVSTLTLPMGLEDRPASSRPAARGSFDVAAMAVVMRHEIGEALRRGDVTEVARGYLALAELLGSSGQRREAIRELEEAVDVLDAGPASSRPCSGRLLLALVTHYRAVGDHVAAARIARDVDARSTQVVPPPEPHEPG